MIRISNSKYLTVLEPLGFEQIGWEAVAIDPIDWVTPLVRVSHFSEIMVHRVVNDFGTGSITLDADDPVLHDPLPAGKVGSVFDYECLWQFYKDGVLRHEWLAEDSEEDVVNEDESRTTKIAGRTTERVLEWGVAAPGEVTVLIPDPKAEEPDDWEMDLPVTTKVRSSGVVTLYLSIAPTHLVVGDQILVDFVDADYNGIYLVSQTGLDQFGVPYVQYQQPGLPDLPGAAAVGTVTQHYEQEWFPPLIPEQVLDPMSFQQMPAITAFRWLMLENVQARGTIPFVQMLFTQTHDSHGVPWADVSDVVVNPGESPLALLQRLSASLGWEFKMLPGFRLMVVQGEFGLRRDAEIKHFIGGQQLQHGRSGTTREIATNVFAKAQDTVIAQAAGVSDATPWKRELWVEAGDAEGIDGATRVANATVSMQKDRKVGRTIKVVDDSDGREMFVDYDVSDWVSVEDERYRTYAVKVVAATVTVDADGQDDLELTIETSFEANAVKVRRMLEKMGASATAGGAASRITSSSQQQAMKTSDLADVSTTSIQPNDLLQWDGTQWVVKTVDQVMKAFTMPPIAIDNLTDVNTIDDPPENGQVLQWDAALSQWVPKTPATGGGGGGPQVGVWENDRTVTFTLANWVENDRQGAPLALGTTRPVAPTVSITITEAMLPVASDAADPYPIGFSAMMVYSASVRHTQSGTLSAELTVNGTVAMSGADSGHTNVERGSIHLTGQNLKVGDVVEFRAWYSATGSTIDWTAWRIFPNRLGNGAGEDGARFLYRDVTVSAYTAPFSPSSTLANIGNLQMIGVADVYAYDADAEASLGISSARCYLSGPTYGVVRTRSGDRDGGEVLDSASWRVWSGQVPTSIKFDRIALPPPPG